jgi:hypothetical protein
MSSFELLDQEAQGRIELMMRHTMRMNPAGRAAWTDEYINMRERFDKRYVPVATLAFVWPLMQTYKGVYKMREVMGCDLRIWGASPRKLNDMFVKFVEMLKTPKQDTRASSLREKGNMQALQIVLDNSGGCTEKLAMTRAWGARYRFEAREAKVCEIAMHHFSADALETDETKPGHRWAIRPRNYDEWLHRYKFEEQLISPADWYNLLRRLQSNLERAFDPPSPYCSQSSSGSHDYSEERADREREARMDLYGEWA